MTTLVRLNALTFCLALAAVGHSPATHAGDTMPQSVQKSAAQTTPAQARDVVAYWQDAGPEMWFTKDPAFDKRFRERFLAQHEAASSGDLAAWTGTPDGTLALPLLLDQYPRNAFRGTPRMYATDTLARGIANAAIAAGQDRAIPSELRLFVYLPFAHSENLADQERSVELCRALGEPHLSHAKGHHDIIHRFGRFPHRNPILGRTMKPEEQKFLDEGGYAG